MPTNDTAQIQAKDRDNLARGQWEVGGQERIHALMIIIFLFGNCK
jgi:hypothetical protein